MKMLNRRTFLACLGALPFVGWLTSSVAPRCSGTPRVNITLDITKFERGLRQATTEFGKFQRAIADLDSRTMSAAEATRRFGIALDYIREGEYGWVRIG